MLADIKGQVAWVTGAGTGIGESAAIKLAEAGCKVILSGRRNDVLSKVSSKIGPDSSIQTLDVSNSESVKEVVAHIKNQFGKVDIGVFSAGVNVQNRRWHNISTEDWDDIIDINLKGVFYCCQAVLPLMRDQGSGLIINISSMASKNAGAMTGPAYTSSKHAVNAITHSLILEERNNGIRATAICPGEVSTPILDNRPVPVSASDREKILQSEDLGELVLFVAKQPPHITLNEILINPTLNRHQN